VVRDVERRHDVRVTDARDEAHLVEEHPHPGRIASELVVDAVDRDDAREAADAHDPAEAQGGRGAVGDLLVDGVSPDDPRRHRERLHEVDCRPRMIIVHHLNNSRSQRVLWMLEELGAEYEIKRYERDAKTMLAPASLRAVHPLGKSPVVTDGDVTLAESGAILEYFADKHGKL